MKKFGMMERMAVAIVLAWVAIGILAVLVVGDDAEAATLLPPSINLQAGQLYPSD